MILEFNVDGKGSGFAQKIEMLPTEPLSNIIEKFSNYRLFARRGMQIYSNQLDRFFTEEEMQNTLLKDSGLTNNSKLIMKNPPRHVEEPEEGEGEDVEEYGQEFDEAAMGGEGGEDEMIEFEEGEDEMEEPFDGQEGGEDEQEEPEAEHDADANEFQSEAEGQEEG